MCGCKTQSSCSSARAAACLPDTAALRASSRAGASGRFAVTNAVSTLALRKGGSYWLHLESGDAGTTLAWSNVAGTVPVTTDGGGLVEGTGSFPGATVGFVEMLEDGLQVVLTGGATADKLWVVRAPRSCSGGP